MTFLMILAAGAAASVYFFVNGSPAIGTAAISATFIGLSIFAAAKKKRVMGDPAKRSMIEKKRRSLEKKFGVDAYNMTVENGARGEAVILKITDTGDRVEDNPTLNFSLEVRPDFGQPFRVDIVKTIPYILMPQFQPGKSFTVSYDRDDRGIMGFVSYRTDDGKTIELSDYPIR